MSFFSDNDSDQASFFSNLKYDLPASIVVFLVAVPLCLGIALASGAPLFSGLIAGMVGGIIVGAISGSNLGVSGPAAGLVAIVLSAIQDAPTFNFFLMAVVLAGVIQFVLGLVKAGVIGYYFPTSVIKGMLSAIGIIIFLKQIPHAVGYDSDYEGDMTFDQADGFNTFTELSHAMDFISFGAVIITVVCLGLMILWALPFMKKVKLFQWVQGPLVAVIAGIVLTLVFNNYVPSLAIGKEHLVSIPVSSSLAGFFGQFSFPDFTAITSSTTWITAFTLAVVASLESLLSTEATDKLDPFGRKTPMSRELIAQGVGNIASGLIGGLPVTQVIVRSSANIQSGGRTRASAIIHGVLIFLCVLLVPNILNMVPFAALAAILLIVGFKLAKPSIFRDMFKLGPYEFIPFMATIIGVLLTDLLIGIGIGMAVALLFILFHHFHLPFWFTRNEEKHFHEVRIELSENVSFLNKARIAQTLEHIADGAHVVIDATRTVRMDHDIMELIDKFRIEAPDRNITLELIDDNSQGPTNGFRLTKDHVTGERSHLENRDKSIKFSEEPKSGGGAH